MAFRHWIATRMPTASTRVVQGIRGPAAAVWAVWTLMVLAALLLIARYAHNVPYYDDWSVVSLLGGTQRVDAEWLWQARNGHRIAFPKLVLVALYNVSGWDFRVGMYFNVLLLAGVAATLIRVTASRRGGITYADAFFPLLLLHWGHYENLLWSWQVTQVIPVVIAVSLLAVIVRSGTRLSTSAAIIAGLGVVALPLSGVPGLAYVPGLALWLAEVGRQSWLSSSTGGRRDALVIWGLTAVAVAVMAAYFVGLTAPVGEPASVIVTAKTMVAFVTQGLTPAAAFFRPLPHLLVLGIVLATVALLLGGLRAPDASLRSRAWSLLLFLVAFSGLALSVGIARPGVTFAPRYALFAAPAFCWVYVTWGLCGRPRAAHLAQAGLALLVVATLGINFREGLAHARVRSAALGVLESDIRQRMPPSQVIARHQRAVLPFPEEGGAYGHERLASSMTVLHRAGIGAFAFMQPEGRFREVSLSAMATVANQGAFSAPRPIWKLNEDDVFVEGIRMLRPTSDVATDDAAPPTIISWRRHRYERFSRDRSYFHWWGRETSATLWIYDQIHELRIELEDPSAVFAAPEILLLLRE